MAPLETRAMIKPEINRVLEDLVVGVAHYPEHAAWVLRHGASYADLEISAATPDVQRLVGRRGRHIQALSIWLRLAARQPNARVLPIRVAEVEVAPAGAWVYDEGADLGHIERWLYSALTAIGPISVGADGRMPQERYRYSRRYQASLYRVQAAWTPEVMSSAQAAIDRMLAPYAMRRGAICYVRIESGAPDNDRS
jgi:predicted RNA-binding protein YlqC (UPF0109 family)